MSYENIWDYSMRTFLYLCDYGTISFLSRQVLFCTFILFDINFSVHFFICSWYNNAIKQENTYRKGDFYMTLGDKIRKYRTLKGLTQAQLGSMVKLTGDRIRQYENDVRKPKDGKLFEIADALDINPSTLAEPDFDDPTSVMHVLFELEDIYGLHFEKVGENYQLAFSKGEYSSANWIIEGLSAWVKKRDELQPDINDSNSTIADKKNDYIRWKARYPYNFAEEITNNFALVQKFNEDASSLLSSDRHPITRFSEFYRSLLALEDAGVKFTISVDEIVSRRSAAFYIKLDYIMNSSDEIKKLYMEFRQCWYDMKEIGIEIHETPVPVNGYMNIALYSDNMQLITLFHAHMRHLEEKNSPMYDEDMYKAEIEDTLQIFNVPVKEYI